jgi:Lactonase, 7-bladed beta-propeller
MTMLRAYCIRWATTAAIGFSALATASCGVSSGAGHIVPASAFLARGRVAPSDSLCPVNCMYVASSLNDEVNVYPTSANGDVVPIQSIAGPSTLLDSPFGIAVDAARNIYVANDPSGSQTGSITVYATDSDGDAAPARTIAGSATGLKYPAAIAVDAAGNVYVANYLGNNVTIYAPGANGNVAPARTIGGANTRIRLPLGIAVDATGKIFVSVKKKVLVFSKVASGNVKPLRGIGGKNTHLTTPYGVALDAAKRLYVADEENVLVYATGAHGNATPVQIVSGPNTGLSGPWGVALDGSANIYVANFFGSASGVGSLTVYGAGANGDTPPVQTVTGGSATLYGPTGLAVL